ncbi:hypothetical protein DV961_14185, partial [Staphylococcus pseudintermedius]
GDPPGLQVELHLDDGCLLVEKVRVFDVAGLAHLADQEGLDQLGLLLSGAQIVGYQHAGEGQAKLGDWVHLISFLSF